LSLARIIGRKEKNRLSEWLAFFQWPFFRVTTLQMAGSQCYNIIFLSKRLNSSKIPWLWIIMKSIILVIVLNLFWLSSWPLKSKLVFTYLGPLVDPIIILEHGSQTRGPSDVFVRPATSLKLLKLLLKLLFFVVSRHF